ncbi:PDZ domain-containing protein [Olivibacter ginsenosidimutans]|uniref:PDZ domain-containing protein n=1 Tax=Olivibacter ginsenosidimutans TaxID=1176537 RepID=A0ABP9C2B3_9SPHI
MKCFKVCLFICCIYLQCFTVRAFCQTKQRYVAIDGSDQNEGTKDSPYASPLKAKEAVIQLRKTGYKGAVEIIITAGTYYLTQPLTFTAEESGSTQHPYTIRAARGEQVIFSAARALRLSWQKYKGDLWKANVPIGTSFKQLFADGQKLICARYPNFDPSVLPFNGYAADAISPERVKTWKNPAGAYVHALHQGRWGGLHYQVSGKKNDSTLQLIGGWQNNRPSPMHPTYRYVENVFEELDSPGEWYLDSIQHTLYYYPQPGQQLTEVTFEASNLENIITLQGSAQKPVHDITIEGIDFVQTAPTFMKTKEPLLRSDWTIYRQGAVKIDGVERCIIRHANFYNLGGNAIFVSNYNRNIVIADNLIENIGAGGINIVGDPDAVRSPAFRYEDVVPATAMDTIPGPKTNNYPAECTVSDNLIRNIGLIEKQVAGVQISMSANIKVFHNTIYRVPRAGINIGDGTWGGHVLAYNDVFQTVLETSDHGAFNSWGRDRFWHSNRNTMDAIVAAHPNWVKLDAIKTTIIRNNRFQCEHGWDIDLDDGSTNYAIYDNLCLSGGLKLREGFYRKVYNNILINNGFHPHVWFKNSHDVFRNNLVMQAHQDIQLHAWGDTVDYNYYTQSIDLQKDQQKGVEAHGKLIEPHFVNSKTGNFALMDTVGLPFKKMSMPHVGVQTPRLKNLAKQPIFPSIATNNSEKRDRIFIWQKSTLKNIETLGEQSAAGLSDRSGVLVVHIPENSPLASSQLQAGDVIIGCEGTTIHDLDELSSFLSSSTIKKSLNLTIVRNQQKQQITIAFNPK